jgi:hypothetical protein
MAIAGADDPVKALEDERAKTRESVAAHRAKATYVSRIPPHLPWRRPSETSCSIAANTPSSPTS